MTADPDRSVTLDGRIYSLDEFGFLDPPEQWDDAFADGMAARAGIPAGLRPAHWRLIRHLRRKFVQERTVPFVVPACIENRIRLTTLRTLFPTGFVRGACRLAGLSYAFLSTANPLLLTENYGTLRTQFCTDDSGFLAEFDSWDERFAAMVVADWNLPGGLNDDHRRILRFLRQRFAATGRAPDVHAACRSAGIDVGALWALFPEGYRNGACRAAGLPRGS
ncbi:MAG: TusE/DsrC/DsvC family sulfur relay protein [Deltaproteobacteria bacterium]|nr:TusE/DsrC/DsvC family sulfur relay protein [Deltaproteobacteria bacterium]